MLGDIVGFLRGHLLPHARAEEQVLYPAVEQAMAAPGATATMRAHHAEIVSRNDRLADTAATVATRCPMMPWPATSPTQLVGLSAILLLHFRKEDEVLLPVLDTTLRSDAAAALFAQTARRRTRDRSAAMITKINGVQIFTTPGGSPSSMCSISAARCYSRSRGCSRRSPGSAWLQLVGIRMVSADTGQVYLHRNREAAPRSLMAEPVR